MQLKEYLNKTNQTQMSFIKEIEKQQDIKIPQSTLAKWITGVRIPRKKEMIVLKEVTKGKVQPNDFYK
jgi:hypothetical protein